MTIAAIEGVLQLRQQLKIIFRKNEAVPPVTRDICSFAINQC